MSRVLILDSETTGVGKLDEIIELAHVELNDLTIFRTGHYYKANTWHNQRYLPSVPIHSKAKEVHGIDFKDLLGKPKSDTIEFPKDVEYLIGHNISFDHRMLGKPEVKLICTMNLCKKMVKYLGLDFPDAKLDTLRDYFNGGKPETEVKHSAMGDVMKNTFVLKKLLDKLPAIQTWGDLYSLQESLKKK